MMRLSARRQHDFDNSSVGHTAGTVHLTFTLPSAVASLVYGPPWPDLLMTIGGAVSRPSIWPYPSICPSRPSSSSLTTFHPLHHALFNLVIRP